MHREREPALVVGQAGGRQQATEQRNFGAPQRHAVLAQHHQVDVEVRAVVGGEGIHQGRVARHRVEQVQVLVAFDHQPALGLLQQGARLVVGHARDQGSARVAVAHAGFHQADAAGAGRAHRAHHLDVRRGAQGLFD